MSSHGDNAAVDAARRQSALIDFDAEVRGDALDELERLGAPLRPDATWDAMAERLARELDVPVGAVNLINRAGRQDFVGVYPTDFGRLAQWPDGFCPHALLAVAGGAFEVHRAAADPAQRGNSLVEAGYECYLAERIVYKGVRLGTVCVIDETDRDWQQSQRDVLAEVAADALARLTAPAS